MSGYVETKVVEKLYCQPKEEIIIGTFLKKIRILNISRVLYPKGKARKIKQLVELANGLQRNVKKSRKM